MGRVVAQEPAPGMGDAGSVQPTGLYWPHLTKKPLPSINDLNGPCVPNGKEKVNGSIPYGCCLGQSQEPE